MIEFYLNGDKTVYEGDPERVLLSVLREDYLLTSAKDGCSGQTFCGACAVEIDSKAALSCSVKMKTVFGKKVVTLEGLDKDLLDTLTFSFAESGAVQCGFCSPGYLMRTKILLDSNPAPNDDEIKDAFKFHFCRCTGFKKIIDAVKMAAMLISSGKRPGRPGKYVKYGAREKAAGTSPYVDDMRFEGMLRGALLFSEYPRAVVDKIDINGADQAEGIRAVLTWKDIPGERVNGLLVKDWPVMIAEGECTRYLGDVLAIVVADNEEQARRAKKLIKVSYRPLEVLGDYEDAEDSDIKIHASGNVLERCEFKRGGPVEELFEHADYAVSNVFRTQRIEHAFMETEAAIALYDGEALTVYTQSQGVYEDRRQLSGILNMPEDNIRVVLVPNGGGFGGKEDLTVQPHACLAAIKTGRPVKVKLNREESFLMHPKRHPMRLDYALACDGKGKLLALKADIIGDTGAYASVGAKVLERAAGHACGAYYVPNVEVRAASLYTNNVPCGAMRGFGVNQAVFAMESSIDELCKLGGFDPWEFRYQNALTEGLATATGQILTGGVGVKACLEALKPAYDKAERKGLACGIKNTGIGNGVTDQSEVKLIVTRDGRLEVRHGWTEMGQGIFTAARLFVNGETGIPAEKIDVFVDTADQVPAGMTTASRGTSLLGNSILDAVIKLKKDLQKNKLEDLAGREYRGFWKCDWTSAPGAEGEAITHYSYGYAAQLAILNEKGGLEKIVAAHDAGRIINPVLFEGQIEGAVHMGLGYALSEEFPYENGYPVFTKMRQLGLIGIKEMPEVEVIGVEVPDPNGPLGAKGVGEIGLVPTAGAVANAFAAFDGYRGYTLPLKRTKAKKEGE